MHRLLKLSLYASCCLFAMHVSMIFLFQDRPENATFVLVCKRDWPLLAVVTTKELEGRGRNTFKVVYHKRRDVHATDERCEAAGEEVLLDYGKKGYWDKMLAAHAILNEQQEKHAQNMSVQACTDTRTEKSICTCFVCTRLASTQERQAAIAAPLLPLVRGVPGCDSIVLSDDDDL